MKVFVAPHFKNPDKGEGGIRRVIEAQRKWLPKFGYEVTEDINQADLCAFHAAEWYDPPVGIPVVAHCHGLYWTEFYATSKGHLSANQGVIKNLKQADAVTAPSEWVSYALKRNMWLDPVVLYHGIDPEEWPAVEPHDNYVLWNKNRVDPICDPGPLNELAARAPNYNFISTFGEARDNVTLTGTEPYTTAKRRVKRAEIYLATTRETFGIGTLEAMAAGVPVLGFDYGGQSEIVVHKEQGYLARPDDYDDLAVGLDYCRQHREYLGRNARAKVLQEFTWEYWIEQYAKLYTRVLAENSVKVSIVITNYNLGQFLPEAVESAKTELSKINANSEIILVDDASTEPLPSAITNDSSLHIIKNPTNLYLAGALNVGVGAARGKYVLLLDADNLVKNLHVLVDALDNDRSLDIAYGKMQVFGDGHAKAWISEWPPKEADLSKQLQHLNQITSTALYRRKLWKWAGAYRDRCRLGEDADFWLRCLALGAKARRVTDLVTLEYRDRADSVSHQNKDWAWNAWYSWANGPYKLSGAGGPIYIHDAPEVSIIIPVGRGHERLVIDAIDSVQAQTYSFWNWECIVVNDTGRDLKYIPSWVRVIPGGQKGVSHARNRGMAVAKGEYVLFLDADDYLHPEAIYHLYHTLITSNCHNVFTYSDWFEAETGKPHASVDFNPKTIFDKLANPVTALYKKWDLTKNSVRWDESFTDGWEDWDFAIQVAAKAGLCGLRLKAPLLHYRVESGFLRRTALDHKEEIKLKIKHKWADYISGEKPNRSESMGCGGCGGGRYPSILGNVRNVGPFEGVDLDKDTTLVEYTPPPDWTGTRSFVGRVTGNRYRFSTEPEGRVRRVYNVDVPGLESLGYFRAATTSGVDAGAVTPLAAPGPPIDEVGGVGGGAAA